MIGILGILGMLSPFIALWIIIIKSDGEETDEAYATFYG